MHVGLSAEGFQYPYRQQMSKCNPEGRRWSFSHYTATWAAQQGLGRYRGVCEAREGSSRAAKFSSLLGNSYGVWVGLSTPAQTRFPLGNTRSDANKSPTRERSGRGSCRRNRGWESALLCRIKQLPKQQEAAPSGAESNFKLRLMSEKCEYQDGETTNPETVRLLCIYRIHAFKKHSQVR